jgi:hypothetical protein
MDDDEVERLAGYIAAEAQEGLKWAGGYPDGEMYFLNILNAASSLIEGATGFRTHVPRGGVPGGEHMGRLSPAAERRAEEKRFKRTMRSFQEEDPRLGPTELAELAADEHHVHYWLDDDTHPIWDWAVDVAEEGGQPPPGWD